MNMEGGTGGVEPAGSFPPLARLGNPESAREVNPSPWDVTNSSADSHDSTSASSSTDASDVVKDRDSCEKIIEQWRLIRLASKNKPKERKIYPYHEVYTAPLGRNYSKFFEAFRQGLNASPANKRTVTTVPAKRPAGPSIQAAKRRRQDDDAPLPHPGQDQARLTPAKRAATAVTKAARDRPQKTRTPLTLQVPNLARVIPAQQAATTTPGASVGPKPKRITPSAQASTESPVTPRPRSEAKDQPSRRKGVGLYAGNWEYATEEEKVPEYLSVVQNIADSEGRTTRRAYAKLTSKDVAGKSSSFVEPSPGNEVRKSGRARNTVDYSLLSGSENNARENATPGQIDEGHNLRAQGSKQGSPSKPTSSNSSASSTRDRSTSIADPSRSTSTTTTMITEQPERPNLSWNSIVYGILASAETPLTFHQLVQGIKARYPYFNSPSQVSILKSGPKNPLYFHEAFCKGDVIDGMQTWTLKPGEFIDKKTGEVMTPQPGQKKTSSRPTDQAHEMEDQTPSKSTLKPSPASKSRSSNPRFGREILNPPEIPDSQEVQTSTSNAMDIDSGVAEHVMPMEEASGEQEVASTGDTSANAFVGTSQPDPAAESNYQWATTSFSPINASSAGRFSAAASATIQGVHSSTRATDDEVSATPVPSLSAIQNGPSISYIPSSAGDAELKRNSATSQPACTPLPRAHTVSPQLGPTLIRDGSATPQSNSMTPAVSSPPVTSIPCTQLDGFLPDGKAGAKEITYMQL